MGCGSIQLVNEEIQLETFDKPLIKLDTQLLSGDMHQPLSRINTATAHVLSTDLRAYRKLTYEIQKYYDKLDPEHTFQISDEIMKQFILENFDYISQLTAAQMLSFQEFPIGPKAVSGMLSIILLNPFLQVRSIVIKQQPHQKHIQPEDDLEIPLSSYKDSLFAQLQRNGLVQPSVVFSYLAQNGFSPNYQQFNNYIEDNILASGIDQEEFNEVIAHFTATKKDIVQFVEIQDLDATAVEDQEALDWEHMEIE